jgi:hypothetical protein
VAAKDQRYFHLHFTWDGDPESAPDALNSPAAVVRHRRCSCSCSKRQ